MAFFPGFLFLTPDENLKIYFLIDVNSYYARILLFGYSFLQDMRVCTEVFTKDEYSVAESCGFIATLDTEGGNATIESLIESLNRDYSEPAADDHRKFSVLDQVFDDDDDIVVEDSDSDENSELLKVEKINEEAGLQKTFEMSDFETNLVKDNEKTFTEGLNHLKVASYIFCNYGHII